MKLTAMICFASTSVPALLAAAWAPAFAQITLPPVTVEKEEPRVARPAAPRKAARPAASARRATRAAPVRTASRARPSAPRVASAPPATPAAPSPSATAALDTVSITPFGGPGLAASKTPANVVTVAGAALDRSRAQSIPEALLKSAPGVNLSDVSGNPFQQDLQYRGFVASPVLGTPQGLAVYQGGVRVNEALGDTMNWDLVTDVAVDRMTLVPNNPAFGLNAIGGALSIEMKNGFTWQGRQLEMRGGSHGQFGASIQAGAQSGDVAAYVAAERFHDSGWRDRSASEVRRLFADVGWRGDRSEFHVNLSAARNDFGAAATTPEDMLRRRWASVYTTPQTTRNELAMLSATGRFDLGEQWTLQTMAYVRSFRQKHVDGNTSEASRCADPANAGFLCLDDDVLTSSGGAPVADAFGGATLGSLDRTKTQAVTIGGAAQATRGGSLFGHGNQLTFGASLDHGAARYQAWSELGVIGPDLFVSGSGLVIDQPSGDIAPVSLRTSSTNVGAFAIDSFDLTSRASLFVGGRFNDARIRLEDQLGTALNGSYAFSRFNPVAGLTYALTPNITAYGGYSEANRAPTPIELGCADPLRPCLLDNFVVSDPPLRQVVSRTYEAGLKGRTQIAGVDGTFTWNVALFRSGLSDDILSVASDISGRGYFVNAGRTRRQGAEAGLSWSNETWSAFVNYAYIDATFQSRITLASPNNPSAVNGLIQVEPGDSLPSVPRHRLKFGADYALTSKWKAGFEVVAASGQYLQGDESNQNAKLPGYWFANLFSTYQLSKNVSLFGRAQNIFNRHAYTFGTFFDPNQIPSLNLTSPRSLAPAAPVTVSMGLRATF